MRHRLLGAAIAAVALVVGVGACGSSSQSSTPTTQGSTSQGSTSQGSQAAAASPVKVGMICTCTGQLSTDSAPMANVYRSWVNTVNGSGGIDGHPIDLTVADDAGAPGQSISAAQSLISKHVDAIVDNTTLDSAWESQVKAAGIPVIGMNLSDEVFNTDSDFYPDGQTTDAAVYSIVSTAKAAGATNIGVIYCAEAPTCEQLVPLVKSAAKQVGLPVVYSASISATAPDYTAQCVAAKSDHVTALALFDVSAPNIRFGTNCHQQSYDPIYVTEGFGYSDDQGQAPGLRQNLWSEYSTLPYWVNTAQVQAMDAAVDKYYPGIRNNTATWSQGVSSSWASGILLEDAVKAGGLTATATPSSSEIVSGLNALHGDDLQGWSPAPLTFTSGQDHSVDCWFTSHMQNGKPALANGSKPTCETQSQRQ